MTTQSQLRDKLRKIEALFAGAGTAGERLAAEAALERVRAKLAESEALDPPAEMQFSMPDQWSRHLFVALCRRYGLKPYRYRRQRRFRHPRISQRRRVDQTHASRLGCPRWNHRGAARSAWLHRTCDGARR